MDENMLYEKSIAYLKTLCRDIRERCVGSEGNRAATAFFEKEVSALGWKTEMPEFNAMDWNDGGATLRVAGVDFQVNASPYSLGCKVEAELVSATNVAELERLDAKGKIVLLHGEIAKEQLMPKNFVFYNPEEHRKIISLLENSGARALVCATGRNAAVAGGVYPFPLIEDGDFDIPSVYMTDREGERLGAYRGSRAALSSLSVRVPGKGYNVIARRGKGASGKIVITAHVDAKKGTPGAIDNATGVVVLLLTACLLKQYDGDRLVEIVALNGEDYYAVPGQMNYIAANQDAFPSICMNINIDVAGYHEGKSAFSFYGVPEHVQGTARNILKRYPGIVEGSQWVQGDHSIFVQYGRPAIAVTSQWYTDNIADQTITHTLKDDIGIADCRKLVEIADAIQDLVLHI